MVWRKSAAASPHLKSMGSYEHHAWDDAVSIAFLVGSTIGVDRARRIFAQVTLDDLLDYERAVHEDLTDFIARTESQRPSVLRRLPDEVTLTCFLVLAILGCLRAKAVIDHRDRYREALAPGRGNRETISSVYAFAAAVADTFEYDWPYEAFQDVDRPEEDEAARPLPQSFKPHIPVEEPDEEPEVESEYAEVLVAFGECKLVHATPEADEPSWRLSLIDEQGRLLTWIDAAPWSTDHILVNLQSIAERTSAGKPLLLLLPKAQAALCDALNKAAGKEIAGLAMRGVGNLSCMKWPDELLHELRRELELIREPMPAAAELMRAVGGGESLFIHCDSFGPQEDWRARRNLVEGWVKALLELRGRWKGSRDSVAPGWSDGERDLRKAKREVMKLANSNRTPLGDVFFELAQAMLQWRSDELSTHEALNVTGQSFFRYLAREDHRQGRVPDPMGDLGKLFGTTSAEMALVNVGVQRQLDRLFYLEPRSRYPASALHLEKNWLALGGWFSVWWCVFEGEATDFHDTRWFGPPSRLVVPANLKLNGKLLPLQTLKTGVARPWASQFAGSVVGHATSLMSWLRGESSHYSPYQEHDAQGCQRWGALMVARGSTEAEVLAARASWFAHGVRELQAALAKPDRRKAVTIPNGVRVLSEPVGFLHPYTQREEYQALAAGLGWDADAKQAVQ